MTNTNRRNLILLTVDSLRADHCGFLQGNSLTPFLDTEARDGVVFENAIASGPRTPSSAPEFITGSPLPKLDGKIGNIVSEAKHLSDHLDNNITLAEQLSKQGYTTAAFTANPWTTPNTNFNKGFDKFTNIGYDEQANTSDSTIDVIRTLFRQWRNKTEWFSRWTSFYGEIRDGIESLPEPYFVWIFLLDTHNPYFVPREDMTETSVLRNYYSVLRGNTVLGDRSASSYKQNIPTHVEKGIKQSYRDTVRSVDRFTSVLAKDLEKDDPILVFHSDHGEAFGEHGTYGHQRVVYEENIHVPLLALNTDFSSRLKKPISLLSIPEICVSLTKQEPIDPQDWLTNRVVTRTDDDSAMAVRTDRWKYIKREDNHKLYNIEKDPAEQQNIADSHEDLSSEFNKFLDDYLISLPTADRGTDSVTDKEMEERLEALGYK